MNAAGWTITVHELFPNRGGCRIFSTCSVTVPSTSTVDDFLKALRNCPQNKDPDSSTNAGALQPFSEKLVGKRDSQQGYKFLPTNPDDKPNCSWTPAPTKTIAEAGLCDNAILYYNTSRICD